jgi:hypothetical protein
MEKYKNEAACVNAAIGAEWVFPTCNKKSIHTPQLPQSFHYRPPTTTTHTHTHLLSTSLGIDVSQCETNFQLKMTYSRDITAGLFTQLPHTHAHTHTHARTHARTQAYKSNWGDLKSLSISCAAQWGGAPGVSPWQYTLWPLIKPALVSNTHTMFPCPPCGERGRGESITHTYGRHTALLMKENSKGGLMNPL